MTRGQGEGSLYQRKDGMWCASIELPEGLDGKRRRKVIARKDKAVVVKLMRDFQVGMALGDKPPASPDMIGKCVRDAFRAERVAAWHGSSRRTR